MATKEQLRRLRQKHHLGEYSNKKSKTVKTSSRGYKMVRHKTHRKKSYSSKGSNLMTTIGASFVYGALRPTLAGVVSGLGFQPLGAYTTPALLGGGGFMLSKQSGFVGAVGKVAMIVEVAGLGATLGSPMLSGVVSNNTTDQSTYL